MNQTDRRAMTTTWRSNRGEWFTQSYASFPHPAPCRRATYAVLQQYDEPACAARCARDPRCRAAQFAVPRAPNDEPLCLLRTQQCEARVGRGACAEPPTHYEAALARRGSPSWRRPLFARPIATRDGPCALARGRRKRHAEPWRTLRRAPWAEAV